MAKEKTTTSSHWTEDRLDQLTTLKNQYELQTKAADWKVKANMKEVNAPWDNDFRTQISMVVKMQKDAEFASSIPEFTFMPENDDGRKNRRVVKHAWDYWWIKSNTDKHIANVVSSATTYWTWILYEWIKHIYKTINTPYFEWETLKFKKERKLIYSGIYSEVIPFENFFINWTDIDNSTEAIVITYYDKEAYIAEKEEDWIYKNVNKLRKTTKQYLRNWNTSWEDVNTWTDDDRTITELRYYNAPEDRYVVVANWIEILDSHIPYTHKELPFCLFLDNKAEDRIWGIGELELLEQDERYKNELRTLLVQGIKASIGFIMKDRETDIEEETLYFWIGEVFETSDLKGLQHFTVNAPINAISEAERKVDNDIIIKSGVDIYSLQTTPETATKTAWKTLSGKKRINKNIKDNAYDFYRRLAFLRMKNIQFIHSIKVREVPIKGWSILNDWTFQKDESGAYGKWLIWEAFIKWDFLVTPIIETMLGNNKQRRLDNASLYAKTVWNIADETGKPVIKWNALAELLTEEFGYDFDKMSQNDGVSKSGEDVLNEIDKLDNWVSMDSTNPASPDFIPPEQRSGAKQQVAWISWQAKLTADEIIADNQ